MPQAEGLSFQEWIRRIWRGGGANIVEPDILPAVQPVLIVGDHRRLVSYIRTRDGLGGFRINSAAGLFSNYVFQSYGRGGSLVHWFTASHPAGVGSVDGVTFTWAVVSGPTPIAPGGGVHSIDPDFRVVSGAGTITQAASYLAGIVTGDLPTAAFFATAFATRLTGGGYYPGPIYVPFGRQFVIAGSTAAVGLHGMIYFTDLDAPTP